VARPPWEVATRGRYGPASSLGRTGGHQRRSARRYGGRHVVPVARLRRRAPAAPRERARPGPASRRSDAGTGPTPLGSRRGIRFLPFSLAVGWLAVRLLHLAIQQLWLIGLLLLFRARDRGGRRAFAIPGPAPSTSAGAACRQRLGGAGHGDCSGAPTGWSSGTWRSSLGTPATSPR
jgi:hypothetical protein